MRDTPRHHAYRSARRRRGVGLRPDTPTSSAQETCPLRLATPHREADGAQGRQPVEPRSCWSATRPARTSHSRSPPAARRGCAPWADRVPGEGTTKHFDNTLTVHHPRTRQAGLRLPRAAREPPPLELRARPHRADLPGTDQPRIDLPPDAHAPAPGRGALPRHRVRPPNLLTAEGGVGPHLTDSVTHRVRATTEGYSVTRAAGPVRQVLLMDPWLPRARGPLRNRPGPSIPRSHPRGVTRFPSFVFWRWSRPPREQPLVPPSVPGRLPMLGLRAAAWRSSGPAPGV